MKYKVDIQDIQSLIDCIAIEASKKDFEKCVNRFTEFTNEYFLDDRAREIKEILGKSNELRKSFDKLSSFCLVGECDECVVKKYCNRYINTKREKNINSKYNIIDLFCGAGGLSLGFTQENFTTIVANDIEECCIDTYAHNHPEIARENIIHGDIKNVIDNIEELVNNRIIDVVVGGPPCQGFSAANRQRLIDDPRNSLYKNYVEIVKRVNPKFFVMENVKGMLSVAKEVKEDFEKLGYDVNFEILNAKNFGVPQNRERLIFIGNNRKINNSVLFDEIHEEASKVPSFLLKDALFGLRPLEASRKKNATEIGSRESGYKIECNENKDTNEYLNLINSNKIFNVVCNHKARYNNERDIEIYGRMDPGDKSDNPKIADIMPYKRRNGIFKDKYFKLEPNNVCKTITAHMKFDCNMYIHPTQARGLTPREAARIQSYPDDYYFKGAYTKTYMQIGNSVPPLMGRIIAKVIKKYI